MKMLQEMEHFIINSSPNLVAELDFQFNIISSNNAFEKIFVLQKSNLKEYFYQKQKDEEEIYPLYSSLSNRNSVVNTLYSKEDNEKFISYFYKNSSSILFVALAQNVPQEFCIENISTLNMELAELSRDLKTKNEKLDTLLLEQSKMADLGRIMDAIAHQWKQPLGSIASLIVNIQNKISMGKYNFNKQSDREKFFQFLEKKLNRSVHYIEFLTKTVDEFREFFRPNRLQHNYGVKDIVDSTLSLMDTLVIKNNIEIIVDIVEDLNCICIKTELIHLLINLINNSIDAFKHRDIKERKIIIEAYRDNDRTIIKVSDTAGGIDPKIIPYIFLNNYTTKEKFKGTGVGLYLAKQIIEKIDGVIEAKNIKNGTCFKITLPFDMPIKTI